GVPAAWVALDPASSPSYLGTSATQTKPFRQGDETTGLYSDAASRVQIAIAGQERLRVTTTTTMGSGAGSMLSLSGSNASYAIDGVHLISMVGTRGNYSIMIGDRYNYTNAPLIAQAASRDVLIGDRVRSGNAPVGLTGSDTVLGHSGLQYLHTGGGNVALGGGALQGLLSGSVNMAMGLNAGANLEQGTRNVFIGQSVGGPGGNLLAGTEYVYNILIGYDGMSATIPSGTTSSWLSVANVVQAKISSGQVILGGTATVTGVKTGVAVDMSRSVNSMLPPTGTTGERPAAGIVGMIRYNSTLNTLEGYQGSPPAWVPLSPDTDLFLGTSATKTRLSRQGDETTGLYSDAASRVQIAIGGIERMRATASGIEVTQMITATGTAPYYAFGATRYMHAPAGTSNVGLGEYALNTTMAGTSNVAIGSQALRYGVTGGNNVAIGASALRNSGTASGGANNTAVGATAGQALTTGSSNLILGNGVASTVLDTGSRNILIGTGNAVTTPAANTNDFLNIGGVLNATMTTQRVGVNMGTTAASFPFQVGTTTSNGNGAYLTGAGVWTNASDERVKENVRELPYSIEDLMKLRPVAYEMIGTHEKQIGFIAQEVMKVVPEVVSGSEDTRFGLSYGNLLAVAVKAIQEQQVRIDALEAENKRLREMVGGMASGDAPHPTLPRKGGGLEAQVRMIIWVGGTVALVLGVGLAGCGVALVRGRKRAA
ncbi:MAG: tail fiber domain-containing protein, partial [Alphaproteobacteria bacterium]|nr:tail fiber domain-containing protein [Alphaproteobacteria bacterium]